MEQGDYVTGMDIVAGRSRAATKLPPRSTSTTAPTHYRRHTAAAIRSTGASAGGVDSHQRVVGAHGAQGGGGA